RSLLGVGAACSTTTGLEAVVGSLDLLGAGGTGAGSTLGGLGTGGGALAGSSQATSRVAARARARTRIAVIAAGELRVPCHARACPAIWQARAVTPYCPATAPACR